MEPMIELKNVSMAFKEHKVLDNLNLQVLPGEILVVIGPSGSGKSTLLRLMIGLLKPTSGEIWVDGQEISQLDEDKLNKIRRNMGMVFQYSALFDSMTVGENVAFGIRQHTKMPEDEILRVIRRTLRMVGLMGKENVMPNELSGGMKKRVSLARAIAINPKIVLYDEPTSGLDPVMASTINRLIVSTRRIMGVTAVVVTHDMDSAFTIADRIAMMYDEKIIEIGTPDEFRQSSNPLVQQFIYGAKNNCIPVRRRASE
jgi:phospholipid/cholesterol/gamma-HCH transport system ATP-binding protein